MTLVEFLKARLAEDEVVARAATEHHSATWRIDDDGETLLLWNPMPDTWGMGQTMNARVTEHIARHDPARVLAEVEAKRRIVAEVEAADWLPNDQRDDEPEYAYGIARAFMDALKILALPYADHADYREEWRP